MIYKSSAFYFILPPAAGKDNKNMVVYSRSPACVEIRRTNVRYRRVRPLHVSWYPAITKITEISYKNIIVTIVGTS